MGRDLRGLQAKMHLHAGILMQYRCSRGKNLPDFTFQRLKTRFSNRKYHSKGKTGLIFAFYRYRHLYIP